MVGTNTDIEDRKLAEACLSGENLVLEMTAKGESLDHSRALCGVVDNRERMLLAASSCSIPVVDNPAGNRTESSTQL